MNVLKIGNKSDYTLKVGSTDVTKIMIGSSQVYPVGTPTPTPTPTITPTPTPTSTPTITPTPTPIPLFNSDARTVSIQSDSKILVGGNFTNSSGSTRNYITRFNSDGTLDTSFNIGTGFNAAVYQVYEQPDGKILAAGDFTIYSGSSRSGIVRLNANGTLDTTFNAGSAPSCRNIAYSSSGEIFVGGTFTSFNGVPRKNLVKLTSNGTVATDFDLLSNVTASGTNQYDRQMAVDSQGRLLVYGTSGSVTKILRLNPNGSTDNTFSSNHATSVAGSTVFEISILSNDKIMIGGDITIFDAATTGSQTNLARLNSDGTLDNTFSSNFSICTGVAEKPDGKLVVVGTNFAPRVVDIDGTFTSLPLTAASYYSVAILPNTNIFFAGQTTVSGLKTATGGTP